MVELMTKTSMNLKDAGVDVVVAGSYVLWSMMIMLKLLRVYRFSHES